MTQPPRSYYHPPPRTRQQYYQAQPIPRIPPYGYNPLPNTRYPPLPNPNNNVPPPLPPFGANTMPSMYPPQPHLYSPIPTVTPMMSNGPSTNPNNKGNGNGNGNGTSRAHLQRNKPVPTSMGTGHVQNHMMKPSNTPIMPMSSFKQKPKPYTDRKNGKSPHNSVVNTMIPNVNIKRESKKGCIKKEIIKHNDKIDISRLNVPSHVHHETNTVYNAVDIEDILQQIKEAMDNDPDPERVKHENYMSLIRRYFRCEISKFSLDWFMHQYYSRYIKLHNAMFKYIRWNAMIQSTNADKYGLGALSTKMTQTQDIQIENYPRLHCKQSEEHKLFRGPPHKKRKLNMPKQLDLDYKQNDFDQTMNKLQQKDPEFQQPPSVPVRVPSRVPRKPIPRVPRKTKSVPLQLEVKDIDEESLKTHNIKRIYHHNECTDTVKYIAETECMSDDAIGLDPIKFERKLRERNITSTNCVSDAESFVHCPLPCDQMYLCNQQIMEICNQLIRRRNFLNNGEKQREIIAIKENYEREWKRDQHQIASDKARKDKFVASFNADIQHIKDELQNSLLQPINDANSINTLMEDGVKPFLAWLHCSGIEYNKENKKQEEQYLSDLDDTKDAIKHTKRKTSTKKEMDESDTDSDEDIPINERLKNEKEQKVEQRMVQLRIHRKNNISTRLKQRLSIAPHSMITCDKKQKQKHNDNDNDDTMGDECSVFNSINPIFSLQSERRLQLIAMLDIEAVDDDKDEDKACWTQYLEKPFVTDGMADIPHVHQCNVRGIHDCLLSQKGYYVPDKQETKKSNQEWKKQYEYEKLRASLTLHKKKTEAHDRGAGIKGNPSITDAIVHKDVSNPLSKPPRRVDPTYYTMPTPTRPSYISPGNYDPKLYPSPHPSQNPSRYYLSPNPKYQVPFHPTPTSPGRRGVSGKGRKGRSGKGVAGKSIGAKRRSLTPNTMRNARYSSKYTSPNKTNRTNGRGMVWNNRSQQPSAACRQRIQSQRMFTASQSQSVANSNMSHRMLSSQRLHRYNAKFANYQRIRNNNSNNTSNSNTHNHSPFPAHYAPYNNSQRR